MERLPLEIIQLIVHNLDGEHINDCSSRRSHRLAPYATLSWAWQQAVERQTFEKLRIKSNHDEFSVLSLILNEQRLRNVRFLNYHVVVDFRGAESPQKYRVRISETFTEAVLKLFQVLEETRSTAGEHERRMSQYSLTLQLGRIEYSHSGHSGRLGLPSKIYLSPRPHLLDEKLPLNDCITELIFSDPDHIISPSVAIGLANRLPRLSELHLSSNDSLHEHKSLAAGTREERHTLALVLKESEIPNCNQACFEMDNLTMDEVVGSLRFSPPDYRKGPTDHSFDPLGAAIRDFGRRLSSLNVIGVLDESLFWPTEYETKTLGLPSPEWLYLEDLTVQMGPCSSNGEWYFLPGQTIPGRRRRALRNVPNEEAMQPLLSAWMRALSNMPALRHASIYWCVEMLLPDGDSIFENWAVSLLAPGIKSNVYVHRSTQLWENKLTADQLASSRLIFENSAGWRPHKLDLDGLRLSVNERFPHQRLLLVDVDLESQVSVITL